VRWARGTQEVCRDIAPGHGYMLSAGRAVVCLSSAALARRMLHSACSCRCSFQAPIVFPGTGITALVFVCMCSCLVTTLPAAWLCAHSHSSRLHTLLPLAAGPLI
jgi:hypothetical protein